MGARFREVPALGGRRLAGCEPGGFGGYPSCGSEEKEKDRDPSDGSAAPGPRLWSRCTPSIRLRVTSDPILRTAGPPAHTHRPGDAGVIHDGADSGGGTRVRQGPYLRQGRDRGCVDRGCRPGRLRRRADDPRADDPAVRVICHPGWCSDGGAARGGVVGSDSVLAGSRQEPVSGFARGCRGPRVGDCHTGWNLTRMWVDRGGVVLAE